MTTPAEGDDRGDEPADVDWRKLHPITPLVRGWVGFVPLALAVLGQSFESSFFGGSGPMAEWSIIGIVLAVALVAVGVWSWLEWRAMSYAITDRSVHMRSGVLVRQHRRARRDRIEAIDIAQPLLARLTGLAELRVEVAGGADSRVRIGFLREPEARALREVLLEPVADDDDLDVDEPASDAGAIAMGDVEPAAKLLPDQPPLVVPTGRLVMSLLRSGAFLALVVALVGLATSAVWVRPSLAAIPFIFAFGAPLVGRFMRDFGFTAHRTDEGVRVRRGLTETRTQSIRMARVQAVELSQGWLWRGKDWWQVSINVAGYGGDDADDSGVVLPVGTREDLEAVMDMILPDGVRVTPTVLRAGLDGQGTEGGFITVPRRARLLAPVSWRREGVVLDAAAVVMRRGRLTRRVVVVPYDRVQASSVEQGPLVRRFGVASLAVHSTPGPVTPTVDHLAADAVGGLHTALVARALVASGPGPTSPEERRGQGHTST